MKGSEAALISLYESVYNEIQVLRDNQFRAALFSLALDAGVATIFTTDAVITNVSRWEKGVAITLSSIVVLGLARYLWVIHGYLTTQRKIRRKIEGALGAHEVGAFMAAEALFPTEWREPGTFKFQLNSLVVPMLATMFAFQSGTILVVLRAG
jgi:uncharacterized protein with PQ loop repeat